ncbi:protein of unknown function DUF362 [Solidesulfovibrio carbinoliphilus subsp. oakridgensis]|uniref:4Fe-4S ferredoxin-type domain-containing protein n=1 Tax=Solidesulfovibrio carbinoliphilus subsp. oakridgensis TaxID=694327 RepID=G7Q6P7_9BACT|nr:DUF362 domain-containing protein [Solidesulfovibrio carbinoliphilus]EHJ47982.1 protein of unknown function DUF362 [Solidesulfovibrio carbinoliphilus subsp. oakridgensis]
MPAMRLAIRHADSLAAVRRVLDNVLPDFAHVFPADRAAPILVKPNLNANMNAQTGNTTDLRLLTALLAWLREAGYTDVVVGEGTNSGFYRNRIGVIARLRVDRAAAAFGYAAVDLNHVPGRPVAFENGVTALVAAPVLEAALVINLPKLKTHFEAGMSVCLKNLMGCLVGQENKKKTHQSLAANIVNLTEAVRPGLHIVDALVAMEGLGPTRGTPLRCDTLVVGENPYLIDLACARLAGVPAGQVRPLAEARRRGLATPEMDALLDGLDLAPVAGRPFAPPVAGKLATFIHSPKRQKYFLAVRNTAFFRWLAGTDWFGALLFKTGLRQDVFCREEMRLEKLTLDRAACDGCGVCRDFCPAGLDPAAVHAADASAATATGENAATAASENEACLGCLYCFLACPKTALAFHGEEGFLAEQRRQYDALVRSLAPPACPQDKDLLVR